MDKKLDLVLDLFYDKKLLLWKYIPVYEIVAFAQNIFKDKLTDQEVDYALDFLLANEYIKETLRDSATVHYSITTKGIQLKRHGGFKWNTRREYVKNSLLYVSYFAIIVAGWYYAIEIYKFYFNCKCC